VTLVQYGRTKGWDLGDVRVAVDYDHHSTPRTIDIAVELGGDLTDAQLERLARVARACPLRRSVEAGMEFAETVSRRPREPDQGLAVLGGAL
jgi:putative redox protein